MYSKYYPNPTFIRLYRQYIHGRVVRHTATNYVYVQLFIYGFGTGNGEKKRMKIENERDSPEREREQGTKSYDMHVPI